ncbi:MAG: peptidoglycan/xylan/chitin deacetylase (PgdA/CDA1 family) [Paraglaciecola sp.]|jgi:peptidoglycan/xylan/chitin deacetylase (PgdA/CDA1 family)
MLVKLLINLAKLFFGMFVSTNKINIVCYHRVDGQGANVTAQQFEQQMYWLSQYFNVMSLESALKAQEQGNLPAWTVCITIDDGYADCHDVIAPILAKYKLSACFFVSTIGIKQGYLWDDHLLHLLRLDSAQNRKLKLGEDHFHLPHDGTKLLNYIKYQSVEDREKSLAYLQQILGDARPLSEFLTSQQIRKLAELGMEIGAHTNNHPILSCESDSSARDEIVQSKQFLEDVTGREVKFFAYPNGKYRQDFQANHVQMVKDAGYLAAVSTDWFQKATIKSDKKFTLPRFTPWKRFELGYCLQLIIYTVKRQWKER